MQETLTAVFYHRNGRDPLDEELVEYNNQWYEWDSLVGRWFVIQETTEEGPLSKRIEELRTTIWVAVVIIFIIVVIGLVIHFMAVSGELNNLGRRI